MTAQCVHSSRQITHKRLGILGGTFDPIHAGHLDLARLALDQARLDQVLLMPCHLPPHRQNAHASGEHRLAMAKLAVAGEAGIAVSGFELEKHSTSYTVETLAHFHSDRPDTDLFFCLGGDSLRQIKSWHRWQEILELANLVVMDRNQGAMESALGLEDDIEARLVASVDRLEKPAGQILRLVAPTMDVSATEVRRQLLNSEGGQRAEAYLQQWLHPDVLKYIKDQQVYA